MQTNLKSHENHIQVSLHFTANCSQPENMTNANLTVAGTLENDAAVYKCLENYTSEIGNTSIVTCTTNGTWSVAPPCLGKTELIDKYTCMYFFLLG